MARALQISLPRGGEEIVPLVDDVVRLDAMAGASYRLIDPENPQLSFEAIIRRIGDDLQIDVLDSPADIVLVDYFFICELDFRGCAIELDSFGGPPGETLTPDNIVSTQLSDGSVLLWTTPPAGPVQIATKTALDAASEPVGLESGNGAMFSWKSVAAVGGGLALLGAAGGGGGGGESGAVGSDNTGSGALAERSLTISQAQSNAPAPVDTGNGAGAGIGPGQIASGGQTNDLSPTLSGTIDQALTAGQQVIVYRDGAQIGQATVNALNWTFTDSGVLTGEHRYSVQLLDADGNQSPLSNEYVLQVDGTAPVVPIINAVSGDNEINAEEAFAGVSVTGFAEAGATVTARWGSSTVSSVADGAGRFELRFEPSEVPGPDVESISVTATDSFGNVSETAEQLVTVGFGIAVTVTGVIDDQPGQTGQFESGSLINDANPTLVGSLNRVLQSGESVQIIRNGVFVGTAEVDGRNWSFTDGRLSNGGYEHVVRVVDGSGNVLAVDDASFGFSVDVLAPFEPSVEFVDRASYRVNSNSAADGVQVGGQAEEGSTVLVTWGGQTQSAIADGDSEWDLTFELVPVANGDSILRAVSVDAAGNVSREQVIEVTSNVRSEFRTEALAQQSVNSESDGAQSIREAQASDNSMTIVLKAEDVLEIADTAPLIEGNVSGSVAAATIVEYSASNSASTGPSGVDAAALLDPTLNPALTFVV